MRKVFLIFLLAAVGLGFLVSQKYEAQLKEVKAEAEEVEKGKWSFSFDPLKVSEMSVIVPGQNVELKKLLGQQWMATNLYGGVPADAQAIFDFLTSLKSIHADERSSDSSLLEAYGLTDEQAIQVILKTDGQLIEHVLLGFESTEKGTNFIMRKDSPVVYAVTEDVLKYLGFGRGVQDKKLNIDQWVKREIIQHLVPENATSLTIKEGRDIFVQVRKNETGSWGFERDYAYSLDPEKVESYLKLIENMRGFAIIPADSVEWPDDGWALMIEQTGMFPIELRRNFSSDGKFYIRDMSKAYAFQFVVYHFENLTRTDGFFFINNLLNLDETKVSDFTAEDYELREKVQLEKSGEKEVAIEDEMMMEPDGPTTKTVMLWEDRKHKPFDSDQAKSFLSSLVNLRFKTFSQPVGKKKRLFKASVTQDNQTHTMMIWDHRPLEGEAPCYPIQIDNHEGNYCLEHNFFNQFRRIFKKD